MIQYNQDKSKAFVDNYSFTRDKHTGYYLSSRTIGARRKRLHVYVWEKAHGEVPTGYSIHHRDRDKGNNDIENLVCLPIKHHCEYHSRKYASENKETILKNLLVAQEHAKEWHKSKAGRAWHKTHYEKMKQRLYVQKEFTCLFCGKVFETSKAGSKFCCNAHKTAHRYASGVDDEQRICVICGKAFKINKYLKTQTCSRSCSGKLKWKKKRTWESIKSKKSKRQPLTRSAIRLHVPDSAQWT